MHVQVLEDEYSRLYVKILWMKHDLALLAKVASDGAVKRAIFVKLRVVVYYYDCLHKEPIV